MEITTQPDVSGYYWVWLPGQAKDIRRYTHEDQRVWTAGVEGSTRLVEWTGYIWYGPLQPPSVK